MRKFILTTAIVLTVLSTSAQNSINVFDAIPDPLFKEYCQRYDLNGDGILSLAEADAVTRMDILDDGYSPKVTPIINDAGARTSKYEYSYIKSLDGIEYFTNLTLLNFNGSSISSIDLSKNTKLTRLNCRENKLTELNLENNTALTNLACGINKLETLDISNNTALTELDCCGNLLSELDLSNNTELSILICCYNKLSTLDISGNKQLIALDCSSNGLKRIDISNNTALKNLYCNQNLINSLDLSNNNMIKYLYCYSNPKLSSIYVWSGFDFDKPGNSLSYFDKDSLAYFKLRP